MQETRFFRDTSYAERRGFLRLQTHFTDYGVYEDGDFVHPEGIVSVMIERGGKHPFTRLDFSHGGRLHIRQFFYAFGKRTIPRLARQFVTDVLAEVRTSD